MKIKEYDTTFLDCGDRKMLKPEKRLRPVCHPKP
jgi:hypothetical protein